MHQGSSIRDYDWWLLATAFAICGVGVLEIWSATHASHLAGMHTHQVEWIGLGIVLMLLLSRLDYHLIMEQAPLLYLIAIVALLGSARFFLALAGMDIGTSFGGIGSSREVMIASLAEPAMLMIVLSVALIAGSTQLSTIADYMAFSAVGLRVSLGLGLIAFIVVALAENARIPVDNPATHLELTMVHEAMVLEYSGRHLAMIELAASLKLLLYVSVISCIFFPFGFSNGYAIALLCYLLKLGAAGTLLGVFEMSIAKARVFRVPNFLGAALMLSLLGVLLLFVSGGM